MFGVGEMDALVTAEWLAERLGDPSVRIVNVAGGSVIRAI